MWLNLLLLTKFYKPLVLKARGFQTLLLRIVSNTSRLLRGMYSNGARIHTPIVCKTQSVNTWRRLWPCGALVIFSYLSEMIPHSSKVNITSRMNSGASTNHVNNALTIELVVLTKSEVLVNDILNNAVLLKRTFMVIWFCSSRPQKITRTSFEERPLCCAISFFRSSTDIDGVTSIGTPWFESNRTINRIDDITCPSRYSLSCYGTSKSRHAHNASGNVDQRTLDHCRRFAEKFRE